MFWYMGITKTNKNKLVLVLAIMFSTMLLPSFEVSSRLPRVRLDDVLIFVSFTLNALLFLLQGAKLDETAKAAKSRISKPIKQISQVFLLFLASYIASNLYGVFVLKNSFGIRDLMEIVTLAKYYLVGTLLISLEAGEREYKVLKKGFFLAFAVIVVISLGQFVNLLNMNSWLTPFLAPGHLDNLVGANPPRVLGTFDNPNMSGIFAVIVLAYVTGFYYFRSDKLKASALLLILIAFSLKLVFLTISRMAVASAAIVLVLMSIWALWRYQWNKGTLRKIGVVFVLTIAVLLTSPPYFYGRMLEGSRLETSTSAQGHYKRGMASLDVAKRSPILGWGTGKESQTTLVDSEYLLIFRRYGLIGALIYLWIFLKPCLVARKHSQGTGTNAILAISLIIATVAVMFFDLTAGLLYNLQLMPILMGLMGLVYGMERLPS